MPPRKEVKARTRQRLLASALAIVDEAGEAALTTIAVTQRAGIAQSSFYVHFRDMDDLLHHLIDDLQLERRRHTRAARRASRVAPLDREAFRDTFRIPMAHSIAHPQLFRLLVTSRHDRSTALGEWSRSVHAENRSGLVEDLMATAAGHGVELDARRAEMIAEGVIALSEAMTLGHLEGRFPDTEEAVDILVTFAGGYLPLLRGADQGRRRGNGSR